MNGVVYMLFFKNKETIKELNQKLDALRAELQYMQTEYKNAVSDKNIEPQLSELSDSVKRTEKQLNKQSASFEDLLDEFQDYMSIQTEARQEREEHNKRELALLEWGSMEREQLRLLKDTLLSDPNLSEKAKSAWTAQFDMIEAACLEAMAQCGVQEAGVAGECFDARVHSILNVIDAPRSELDGIIAEVYSPGLFFCGNIIRKARVAVYRWKESLNAEEADNNAIMEDSQI